MQPTRARSGSRHGITRVISKSGLCSRSEAERRVRAGRVAFGDRVVLDPEFAVRSEDAQLVRVDGKALHVSRVYLALNKPRGSVTTASDEKGRRTVYECLAGEQLPWVAPVGRLDQASEGLLLFSNDPEWAAHITDPEFHLRKIYHVQVRGAVDDRALATMQAGVAVDSEVWSVASASVLRVGARTTWLEIALEEGRNRQIRRIFAALNFEVLRLVRVAIGELQLGELQKGAWRILTDEEVAALRR